jgi:uncharacterized protein (DUF58 family)
MIYVLILLIVLGITVNMLSIKYAHYNLSVKRLFSKNTFEIGEDIDITYVVENNKILPVTYLQLLEVIPKQLVYKDKDRNNDLAGNTTHKITMSIMPKQRVKRTYKASINKRGKYAFNKTDIIVGDFLGTKSVVLECDFSQEVIIYPEAVSINNELKPYGSYYGDISVQRWIINDPVLNIGIREYTGSEPQKNIHWASSLRLGKLMVKNFDYTTDNKVMLVLNIESQKPFWTGIYAAKIERCISITRAIIEELEASGIQYGFTTNALSGEFKEGEKYIPFGHGRPHFFDILDILGSANYGISNTYEKLLEEVIFANEKSTTYILITPSMFDEYIENINILSKHSEKTILISFDNSNLHNIDEKVMVFIGKEGSNEYSDEL